jgi:hypothetical protein
MEDGVVLAQDGRRQQLCVAGHPADGDRVAVHAYVRQVGQVVDVDEDLGPRQAQLHHRQQAVAAGDEPGLGAMALE